MLTKQDLEERARLLEEQKENIQKDVLAKMRMYDICDKYGCSSKVVRAYALEVGIRFNSMGSVQNVAHRCVVCSKEFFLSSSHQVRKTCSRACTKIYKSNIKDQVKKANIEGQRKLSQMTREEFVLLLNTTKNNSEAASVLGVSTRQLCRWYKKHGLRGKKLQNSELQRVINARMAVNTLHIHPKWVEGSPYRQLRTEELFVNLNASNTKSDTFEKRLLSEVDSSTCDICGISEWAGQRITTSIIYKNFNSEDRRPSNVAFACPNCKAIHQANKKYAAEILKYDQ